MANIFRNFFARGLRDASGEAFVEHRTSSGKSLLIRKPLFDDNLAHTATQNLHLTMLQDASRYASFADSHDIYRHKAIGTAATAYYLALTDWFGAPRVLEINVDGWTGQAGQTIRVKARDNVMVARVLVVIRDAEWKVLEMGGAAQSEVGSPWWHYTTRSSMLLTPFPSVEAIARDLSGNMGSFLIS